MKKVIGFALILLTIILFTSCTTQQRVVYRDCDCNTNTFGFGWNTNPYWGWNDPFWGWNNSMLWGWDGYPYRMLPRYYIQPNTIQPQQPTRYERRTTIGGRPNRMDNDNLYPLRNQTIPRLEANPSQQNTQPIRRQSTPNVIQTPSRVQQRTNTPSSNQPSRISQPQQRTTTPSGNQPTRRGGSNY
jgi:hypothetical protein